MSNQYDRKMTEMASQVGVAEARAEGLQDELDEATRRHAAREFELGVELGELQAENRRLSRRAETAEAARDELDAIAPRSPYESGRRRAMLGAGR